MTPLTNRQFTLNLVKSLFNFTEAHTALSQGSVAPAQAPVLVAAQAPVLVDPFKGHVMAKTKDLPPEDTLHGKELYCYACHQGRGRSYCVQCKAEKKTLFFCHYYPALCFNQHLAQVAGLPSHEREN
jgi:hypothetical protein